MDIASPGPPPQTSRCSACEKQRSASRSHLFAGYSSQFTGRFLKLVIREALVGARMSQQYRHFQLTELKLSADIEAVVGYQGRCQETRCRAPTKHSGGSGGHLSPGPIAGVHLL